MHNITLIKLNESFNLCHPEKVETLDVNSSASRVVTDFSKYQPLMLESDVNIDDALKLMMKEHIRLKIVIDKSEKMVGSISFVDLVGEKAVMMAKTNGARSEVKISDIMTPINQLKALPLSELNASSIKDVIHLLKDEHIKNIFVANKEKEQVVGLISARDIAKKLSIPLKIDDGPTFHSIFNML